jgi:excisionase family DNA binding protein
MLLDASGRIQYHWHAFGRTKEAFMEKLCYSIEEVCRATSIGRTTLYAHIKEGNLKAVNVGGRTIIRADELDRFLSTDVPKPGAYRAHPRPCADSA